MNYSTVVLLINKNVRAIMATYESGDTALRTMFKTLDPDIKDGDLCIVPTDTRHKFTVVKVIETDVDVDFDNGTQIAWVVGKVDQDAYKTTLEQEGVAITKIKSAEQRKKRDDLRASLLADSAADIQALPIYQMEAAPVATE
jgi:hypothetical protein